MSRGIIMIKVREILRLYYELKLSQHEIAKVVNISSSSVNRYLRYFTSQNLQWPIADEVIIKHLRSPHPSASVDYNDVHIELKRHKSMTLQLIWEEYFAANKTALSYSHFTNQYRTWKNMQPSSMRQIHIAGEKVFVDYCGQTVAIVDPATSVSRQVQIFVGVLGASNYTYIDATWSQNLGNWIGSHVRMFSHFGGVPALVVPDNLKSAVNKADLYEAEINRTYAEFARHYGIAIMPARPYKPKDKAKAENGVLIIERWVLMRLRNMTFYSLEELNTELRRFMQFVNDRRFKKSPSTRRSLFELLDQPALKPLPLVEYEFKQYKRGKVGSDYHVELLNHYYSVPYQYVRQPVDIWYSEHLVEIYANTNCLAKHIRSMSPGGTTTLNMHMPESHKKHIEWTDERCLVWARNIGIATLHLVQKMLSSVHSERARRSCVGLVSLAKRYGNARLEQASNYALQIGAIKRPELIAILEHNLDAVIPTQQIIVHDNIRGGAYYA